jgi:uncharacterized coiled-coil DUF342 family protein
LKHFENNTMADSADELHKQFIAAQEAVTKQGDTVRSLKAQMKEGSAVKVRLSP